LLNKLHRALKPGGKVATLELCLKKTGESAVPAAFALIMLAENAWGDAYTRAELEHMFDRAGFSRHEFTLCRHPASVLVSTRMTPASSHRTQCPGQTLVSAGTSGETGDPSNRVGISSVVWSILVLPASFNPRIVGDKSP